MELGLFQKQKNNIIMTAKLRQSINLLQYSTIELAQYLREKAEENPLIQLEEQSLKSKAGNLHASNINTGTTSNEEINPLDFVAAQKPDLRKDLLEQVQFLHTNEQNKFILNYLVMNLTDKGLLPLSNTEIAELLSIDECTVAECVDLLHHLEPAGIGARYIKESLLLQAKYYYPDESILHTIIQDYLELLADKKWQQIAQEMHISLSNLKYFFQLIQTLHPYPCNLMDHESTVDYSYPDIIITQKEYGTYNVSVNDKIMPNIEINNQYMHLKNENSQTSKYINNCYNQYLWLINSIEQRRSTLLKTAEVLIAKQQGFLENGLSALNAMTMKEMADDINVHESTISRIAKNKIIRTPAGTFKLSKLFSSKLEKKDGGFASAPKVKMILKQFIHQEDKNKPFSDQKISDYLKEEKNISISRRTIAKYREELNILPASKRKVVV